MIVLAHRGRHPGTRRRPDNTIAAFERAIRAGMDGVEVDVRGSSDGLAVLFHDARCRGRSVASLTRDALSRLSRREVPTLDEALDRLPGAFFDVELKTAAAVDAAAPALRAADPRRLVVTSFLPEVVAAAARRLRVPCGLILARPPRTLANPPWRRLAADPHVRTLVLHLAHAAPRVVDAAHTDGFMVYAWGVARPAHRRRAVELGIDGIVVDP